MTAREERQRGIRLPRVIFHNAVSLDGRIDGFEPDADRFFELAAVFGEDATLAGADTLLSSPEGARIAADEPIGVGGPDESGPQARVGRPLLVVPDSRGRIRGWGFLKSRPYWRDAVALCSASTLGEHLDYLRERGVATIVAGEDHVDLPSALAELAQRFAVRTLRVDSGGVLSGILLDCGLVDEISMLVHPVVVGGAEARSFLRATTDPGVQAGALARFRLKSAQELADGLMWLRYERGPKGPGRQLG